MSGELINSHYYLWSILVMLVSFGVFIFSFEKRKPQARELVTLAVMSAIAVASRAAFIMIPFFKPMSGIIMITGMAFGPGAGFLCGSVSAFVSNFIFGQGPWTPWQMLAYAMAGLIAGFLRRKNIMHEENKLPTALFGFAIIMIVVGPILDTCSVFTMGGNIGSMAYVLSIYASGVMPNLVHAVATFLTLLLLCKPMMEKLNRMKLKYGMMSGEEDFE